MGKEGKKESLHLPIFPGACRPPRCCPRQGPYRQRLPGASRLQTFSSRRRVPFSPIVPPPRALPASKRLPWIRLAEVSLAFSKQHSPWAPEDTGKGKAVWPRAPRLREERGSAHSCLLRFPRFTPGDPAFLFRIYGYLSWGEHKSLHLGPFLSP